MRGDGSWFAAHETHPQSLLSTASAADSGHIRSVATAGRLAPGALSQLAAPNGTVQVTVDGSRAGVTRQVRALGGRVLTAAGDSSVVVIGRARLAELSQADDVRAVDTVDRPFPESTSPGSSQAVPASGADAWQRAGITGAGVKLAIVDVGFSTRTEFDAEIGAGHLGAGTQIVNEGCTDSSNDPTPNDGESHGLAVAEVAQQQAPDAQLYLYCVASREGLANAVTDLLAAGVTIASSSLGWYLDGRGDGSALPGSVSASVRYARQHGVLWINSAGNEVPEHYSGYLADHSGDHYLDIGNASGDAYPFESNFYTTAPGSVASPASQSFFFQWDEWPAASHQLTLQAYGVQCTTDFAQNNGLDNCRGTPINSGRPITDENAIGSTPTLAVTTTNTRGYVQIWELAVYIPSSFTAGRRYDLFAAGNAYFDSSDLSCQTHNDAGRCTVFSAAARNGSIVSPASSPYAMAVGAEDAGAGHGGDSQPTGTVESFSSQGPTIDGRTKPDIAGWDGLSSYVADFSDGFYGTSAAAPSVAGAAALVKSVNPGLDAAQLQSFLEQRANGGAPINPGFVDRGHGGLTLGTPPGSPQAAGFGVPTAAQYTALTAPQRLLNTLDTTGGHHRMLAAGEAFVLPVDVPAGATAVAVNLSVGGATGTTYVSAYAGNTRFPYLSNLLVTRTSPSAAASAYVALHADSQGRPSITVRSSTASVNINVDEVGYFAPGAGSGYTAIAAPRRLFNTHNTGALAAGRYLSVGPGMPSDATAVVVNLGAASLASGGWLTASSTCATSTSVLTFGRATRTNLATVRLDGSGRFCLGVHGGGPANVLADVVGYFGGGGSGFVALPVGQRIVDTRTNNGNGGGGRLYAPLNPNSSTTFFGSNFGDLPAGASALCATTWEMSATANGYLHDYPGTARQYPTTTTLYFLTGATIGDSALVPLSATHQFGIYNSTGSTQALMDVYGYFTPQPVAQ